MEPPMIAPTAESPGKGRRVLVCDDEPHILRLVEVNLQRLGYDVETSDNGEDAIAKAEACPPDILIVDLVLPFQDGFDVIRRVRERADSEACTIVVLTTATEEADVRQALEAGANHYLTKPFDAEVFTALFAH